MRVREIERGENVVVHMYTVYNDRHRVAMFVTSLERNFQHIIESGVQMSATLIPSSRSKFGVRKHLSALLHWPHLEIIFGYHLRRVLEIKLSRCLTALNSTDNSFG